ncbi:MAG: hypothetical protein EA359_08445 [Balneolaceae bacterium]|nr:MAG: hypothetical protein EA359_08445 [Balneolaceae bacterium]
MLSFQLFFNLNGWAQVSPFSLDYPQNHLPWFTIESDHFLVHFQQGNSRTAQVVSQIADDIYEPVTKLYGHKPRKKVSIILRDREDFSNGAAFFYDDKIEIWLPALDTPFRGTHPWLRNVITHEFTHIVQLGASMSRTQTVPAIYFQWLNYEDVRRPDVLYGFPKGIFTLPFASVNIPAWFAEGTAQYQVKGHSFDFWDSHRDMLLRTRILSDTHLDLIQMGTFESKNSLERELVYNQGYDFTRYLTNRFGENIIAEISAASAQSGRNNFNHAIRVASGFKAQELFEDWVQSRKKMYSMLKDSIDITESEIIEERGFMNFYPQFNNDGTVFAYLTNRTRDIARTSLVIQKDGTDIEVDELGGPFFMNTTQQYNFSHGFASNPSIEFVNNRFSFSPDGRSIAYSRANKNRYGETYQDIYIYDILSGTRKKITESKRVQDPAWHPEKNILAAVQLLDGTQNLVLINLDDLSIDKLTDFNSGETVYTPIWSPDQQNIYFAMAASGNRNIARYDIGLKQVFSVFVNDNIDYRDPWIDTESGFLYFSSDASGIFNIYKKESNTTEIYKVTEVIGGAFMPYMMNDQLYFSEFFHDGYKISTIPVPEFPKRITETISGKYITATNTPHYSSNPDYYHVKPLSFDPENRNGSGIVYEITGSDDNQTKIWYPYRETSTGLSIFPVLRFDNYTKLEGSNSRLLRNAQFGNFGNNLWRDFKAGAYFSTRDVTERFSLFGGALIGFGSVPFDGLTDFFSPTRLNKLDRDLFLIAEYRGFPFIRRSWSPTISIELYNISRNVKNGIVIEEFPCTSCLPVDKSIDIRYELWEANLFLRSKLNRWSLIELSAAYSPYSVNTQGFFSQEFREFIPGTTSRYFRGSSYTASYVVDATIPAIDADIAPTGLKGSFSYRFEPGRLLKEFELNDGILSPVFSKDLNQSIEFRSRYGLSITDKTNAMITMRVFSYLNNPEDYFYQDYTGGLIGLRSYPYFSIGGQRTFFTRASLLHPLFSQLNYQIRHYTLDKIYAHIYYETGNGWGGPLNIGNNLKNGIGAELRFSFNSSYLFPMKFFMNASYGIDQFNVTFPQQFISTSGMDSITYGREFLFYFGLTFDFDLL